MGIKVQEIYATSDNLAEKINEFIVDKEVIDIKYQVTSTKHQGLAISSGMIITIHRLALVIYRKREE